MASYTISEIKKPPGSSTTKIGKFLNVCREYCKEYYFDVRTGNSYDAKMIVEKYPGTENQNIRASIKKKHDNLKKIFDTLENNTEVFYEIKVGTKDYISFPKEVLDKIYKKNAKENISLKQITKFIKEISGLSDNEIKKYDFFERVTGPTMKTDTKAKQDLTCLAIWYVFNNTNVDFYKFHEYLKTTSDYFSSNKTKLYVNNTTDTLKNFLYVNNKIYLNDSFATAMTIKNKLKLSNPGDYIIAEEDSAEGMKLKKIPYLKISSTESNYFSSADKLTTADLYLIRKSGGERLKTLYRVFNQSTLTHKQYETFINSAYLDKDIIPISLKQLKINQITQSFDSNKFKIINPPNSSDVDQKDKDPYQSIIDEFSGIKSRSEFIKKLEDVIEIRENSFNYRFKSRGRTTFDFDIIMNIGDKSKPLKYQVFMQSGQYYIKPYTSSSASGIGGMSRDFLNNQVIQKLSNKSIIFNELKKIREESFGDQIDVEINFTESQFPGLTYSKPSATTDKKVFAEANKLGITDKRTWSSNYENNKDKKKKELYYNNIINKIYSQSLYRKRQQLINAAVDANLLTKEQANSIDDIKELAKIIKNAQEYKGLKNYPILKSNKILSPGNIENALTKIVDLPIRVACVDRYAENLVKHINGYQDIVNEYNTSFKSFRTNPNKIPKVMVEKLSSFELMYVFSSGREIIMEWVKNSIILSMYSLASAGGVVIFEPGSTNDFQGIKEVRKNPVYVKIGE